MQLFTFFKTIFSCREATTLSLRKEDGKLRSAEKLQLFLHLLYCHVCRRFIKQSRQITHICDDYRQHISQHPTYTLTPEAKDKMQQQLNNLQQ